MDYLISEPYNYLLSFVNYIIMPYTNSISNLIIIMNENTSKTFDVINDTLETTINDFNSISLSDITMNDINHVIYEYKLFILFMTLFSIITFYFVNKLIDEYLIKLNQKNTILKINTGKSINFNTINKKKLENHKPIIIKNIIKNVVNNENTFMTKGLFVDSVLEINANKKNIVEKIMVNKIINNNYYYALLRIKMKEKITLNKTNYNLQTIIIETDNDAETFSTGDMYMIIKFNYTNLNINISHIIVNIMNILNYLSPDEYKNEDFIVLAISKDKDICNNNNTNEFYNALHNIKYDLCNLKQINLNKNHTVGFTLLLPLKQIYELFLDVYNDIIFESTSYKIDFDNNECWYNNSINDIF